MLFLSFFICEAAVPAHARADPVAPRVVSLIGLAPLHVPRQVIDICIILNHCILSLYIIVVCYYVSLYVIVMYHYYTLFWINISYYYISSTYVILDYYRLSLYIVSWIISFHFELCCFGFPLFFDVEGS